MVGVDRRAPGLFSIIVPSFNRAGVLVAALDSVLAQSYRPIQIVLVDDGSTDDTAAVFKAWIDRHGTHDFRGEYLYQANAGAGAARNAGIRRSEGDYIQFLDSDDSLHADRLERLVATFESTGCDYIETGFEGFSAETGQVVERHLGHVGIDQVEWLLRGRLWPNTLRAAYTRQLVARTGPWNEHLKAFEDYEYAIRALTLSPLPKAVSIEAVLASACRDSSDRRSRFLKTRQGRIARIHCERVLCDAVRNRDDIPSLHIAQLASRLYGLALRSNAMGWRDLGYECRRLADSLDTELDRLGQRRRLVARLGVVGGKLYDSMGRFRRLLGQS